MRTSCEVHYVYPHYMDEYKTRLNVNMPKIKIIPRYKIKKLKKYTKIKPGRGLTTKLTTYIPGRLSCL